MTRAGIKREPLVWLSSLHSCLSTIPRPSGATGRHATLRTSCPDGLGSSTLPLVNWSRERRVERQEPEVNANLFWLSTLNSFLSTFHRRRWTRVQPGLISLARRVQLPNLPLRRCRVSSVSHDRVRKPAKRSGREPGDSVGSTPTSVSLSWRASDGTCRR